MTQEAREAPTLNPWLLQATHKKQSVQVLKYEQIQSLKQKQNKQSLWIVEIRQNLKVRVI